MKIYVAANFVRKSEISPEDFRNKLTELKEEALKNVLCLSYEVMVGEVVAFINEEWIASVHGNNLELSERHEEILKELRKVSLMSMVVFDGIRNRFTSAFKLEELK